MGFTKIWARFYLALLRGETFTALAVDNVEYELNTAVQGIQIGIGVDSTGFDNDQYVVIDEIERKDATVNPITENESQFFFTFDADFGTYGTEKIIREYGTYLKLKDIDDNDRTVLIRRDLPTNPYTIIIGSTVNVMQKMPVSII